MRPIKKIPTTIVTGFLGSGKTTLLRSILTRAESTRIAVIVNEFGELGIDGDLLRHCPLECPEEGSETVYELANGCLCCTVQEEFFPVMQQLVERREQIDHILIETSGLALPKPLVQAFQWPEIRNACTVDAVITVVDGPAVAAGQFACDPASVEQQRQADENLDHNTSLHELFEDQLAAADLVILNKCDLLEAPQIEQVRRYLEAEIPPRIKIVPGSQEGLELSTLLGLESASEDFIHTRRINHSHAEGEDHDHDAFNSIVVTTEETGEVHLLNALQQLVEEFTIFRVKGFASIPGKPMRLLIQGVGGRFDRHYDRRWQPGENRQSRFVLIGMGLESAHIESRLDQILACPA